MDDSGWAGESSGFSDPSQTESSNWQNVAANTSDYFHDTPKYSSENNSVMDSYEPSKKDTFELSTKDDDVPILEQDNKVEDTGIATSLRTAVLNLTDPDPSEPGGDSPDNPGVSDPPHPNHTEGNSAYPPADANTSCGQECMYYTLLCCECTIL